MPTFDLQAEFACPLCHSECLFTSGIFDSIGASVFKFSICCLVVSTFALVFSYVHLFPISLCLCSCSFLLFLVLSFAFFLYSARVRTRFDYRTTTSEGVLVVISSAFPSLGWLYIGTWIHSFEGQVNYRDI